MGKKAQDHESGLVPQPGRKVEDLEEAEPHGVADTLLGKGVEAIQRKSKQKIPRILSKAPLWVLHEHPVHRPIEEVRAGVRLRVLSPLRADRATNKPGKLRILEQCLQLCGIVLERIALFHI